MKTPFRNTVTALFLASASSAVLATPGYSDGQSRFIIGDIAPAPIHLDVPNTFEPEAYTGNFIEYDSAPSYVEDVADPLANLPELNWNYE